MIRDSLWMYYYGMPVGIIAIIVSAMSQTSLTWIGPLVAWTCAIWSYAHYLHPRICKRGTDDLRQELFLIKLRGES